MPSPDKKRAIISVSDTRSLDVIASAFDINGYEIFATKGTAAAITCVKPAGLLEELLEDTSYEVPAEVVDPRIRKEAVAFGIANTISHSSQTHGIEAVCVNLRRPIRRATGEEPRIDQGGQAILLAAVSKGLIVVSDVVQHEPVAQRLIVDDGRLDAFYMTRLAGDALGAIARYNQGLQADFYEFAGERLTLEDD